MKPLIAVLIAAGLCGNVMGQEKSPQLRQVDIVETATDKLRTIVQSSGMASSPVDPYCGVFASVRALNCLGGEFSSGEFATVEYISNRKGSTPQQLVQLVEAAGFSATPMENLSRLDIQTSGLPVVANVRSSPFSTSHDHWVCVIASQEIGRVTVFDGPNKPVDVPWGDFLSLWNGFGIVVSKSASPVPWLWIGRTAGWIVVVCPAMVAATLLSRRRKANQLSGGLIPNCWMAFGITLWFAVAGYCLFGDPVQFTRGFELSTIAHRSAFDLKVVDSEQDLDALARSEDILLIDARYAQDYRYGTVRDAVNIPFHSSSMILASSLGGNFDKDIPIVVFCQSRRCAFSHELGKKLLAIGFRNVTVSLPGVNEMRKFYGTNRKDVQSGE